MLVKIYRVVVSMPRFRKVASIKFLRAVAGKGNLGLKDAKDTFERWDTLNDYRDAMDEAFSGKAANNDWLNARLIVDSVQAAEILHFCINDNDFSVVFCEEMQPEPSVDLNMMKLKEKNL